MSKAKELVEKYKVKGTANDKNNDITEEKNIREISKLFAGTINNFLKVNIEAAVFGDEIVLNSKSKSDLEKSIKFLEKNKIIKRIENEKIEEDPILGFAVLVKNIR